MKGLPYARSLNPHFAKSKSYWSDLKNPSLLNNLPDLLIYVLLEFFNDYFYDISVKTLSSFNIFTYELSINSLSYLFANYIVTTADSIVNNAGKLSSVSNISPHVKHLPDIKWRILVYLFTFFFYFYWFENT